MRPEVLFLRYAFPCTLVKMARKELSNELYERLEKAALRSTPVERSLLEQVYPGATSRMKALAREKNQEYFSEENIREYFTGRHNDLLDGTFQPKENQGPPLDANLPPAIRELCKIITAKVAKKGDTFYVVEYAAQNSLKKRVVSNALVRDAEVGDAVVIHYGYAVESVR